MLLEDFNKHLAMVSNKIRHKRRIALHFYHALFSRILRFMSIRDFMVLPRNPAGLFCFCP